MKRHSKWISLLLSALMLLSLCACGSTASTETASASESAASAEVPGASDAQSVETTVVTVESGDKEAIEAARRIYVSFNYCIDNVPEINHRTYPGTQP